MKPLPEAVKEMFRELGRQGGKAAAESMTPEQKTKRARAAGKARARKAKQAKGK